MDTSSHQDANRPTPVVFVPGYGHADRGWNLLSRHLHRAGFTNVSSVPDIASRGDIPHRAERLAGHVATVLELTGAQRVHLVAHNVGGVVARYYLQLLGGDSHLDTVVSVGTPHTGSMLTPVGLGPAAAQLRPGSGVLARIEESTRPLATRWISYFADSDVFVQPATSAMLKHPLMRATNVLVEETGHLSLILPTPVCRSIAQQLAAADGIPGYGAPLASLSGGVVRLDGDRRAASSAAVEAAKAAHPSRYGHPAARVATRAGSDA